MPDPLTAEQLGPVIISLLKQYRAERPCPPDRRLHADLVRDIYVPRKASAEYNTHDRTLTQPYGVYSATVTIPLACPVGTSGCAAAPSPSFASSCCIRRSIVASVAEHCLPCSAHPSRHYLTRTPADSARAICSIRCNKAHLNGGWMVWLLHPEGELFDRFGSADEAMAAAEAAIDGNSQPPTSEDD